MSKKQKEKGPIFRSKERESNMRPVYATQGGGLAEWDSNVRGYVFVEPPVGFIRGW